MGIDFAGDIAALGPDVTRLEAGDRVMVDPVDRVGAAACSARRGTAASPSTARVPAHHLVRLPADVALRSGGRLPVAYGTALRMMVTIGEIKAGEKVLILGASGGVGTCCVQLAKLAGAQVIACASSDDEARAAEGARRRHRHRLHQAGLREAESTAAYGKPHLRQVHGGVDVVVNFTGGDTWVPSLRVLHRQGGSSPAAPPPASIPKEDLRFIWTFELNILGSNGWLREDLVALLELVRHRQAHAASSTGGCRWKTPTRPSRCWTTAACSARSS